jgi:hypothetical protein
MAVMARETWTDERLDDLSGRVEAGFRELREEMTRTRAESGEEFRAMRAEIAAMQRSIHQLTFGLIGAMLTGFLATIATILATAA